MNYETLLKNAPEHASPDFILYLRENNRVAYENRTFLVIENAKYHNKGRPWLTAFKKNSAKNNEQVLEDLILLYKKYGDWQWIKKSAKKQTVRRFHLHLINE